MRSKSTQPTLHKIESRRLVQAKGLGVHPLSDLYHWLLQTSWAYFVGLVASLFFSINALFALGYWLAPGGIANTDGSLFEAFVFSVHTMGTIGYGSMYPQSTWVHLLVVVETLVGILNTAVVTGLTFAKFARPTARVIFSEVAVVTQRDGVRSLMFRMANQRSNQIVEASLNVVMARSEQTLEGERVRRLYDLPLVRNKSIGFALTWTAVHPITPSSPLHGATTETLLAGACEIIVSLAGVDDTMAQAVHARTSYLAEEIRFDERFVDILTTDAEGTRWIDYRKFHSTLPDESGAALTDRSTAR